MTMKLYNRQLLGLHVRHSGHLENKEHGIQSHVDLSLNPEDSSTGYVARGRPFYHSEPQLPARL